MGRITVEVELSNAEDLVRVKDGTLAPDRVRRVRLASLVDTGASYLVIPESIVQQLGVPEKGQASVRYADHRTATRPRAEEAFVEILGRHAVFNAVVEPKRDSALIGAIVLEALDLLVDCTNERLVPRDPRFEIVELE